jgi:hypothetical protein
VGILAKAITPKMSHNYVGRESFRTSNPYMSLFDCYTADEYASQFPNIRAIANEYMTIRPYAIGSNGEPAKHSALDALYHPNKVDSSVLFAEKIAVSTLSLPITYILVWRKEGNEAKPGGNFGVKGRNIAGYTFLESPAVDVREGRKYYRMGSQEFNEDEVMELPGGAKPKNLYAGYSPSMAASRWSTLDSYIADFQKGFFENGAIPAGQFVITSVSKQDYEDTVKKMQESHRGAGKNNNVTYTPRPVDPNTNKPAEAKIEWIPYQQSNKDIDFEPLLKHVDNRLSEAYGVSSIIKGVDSAAKYSNAEVSENGFAKRAVNPLALRNYTQITHELNRITGGLGVAITYKYQIPAISDAEFVKAKTKNTEIMMINALVDKGYTLDSAVDALELSPAYKLLEQGSGGAVIDNDKPDVDEGDEVDDAPDPSKIDGVTPLNKKPKAKKKASPKAELTDEEKLEAAARDLMEVQVNRAIKEFKDEPVAQEEATEAELDEFIKAMMAVITGILIANGESEYAAGVALAGLDLDDLQGFTFTTDADDAYRAYLKRVGASYSSDTAESIRKVLLESRDNGLNRRETEAKLKDIFDTDDYRVKRLARTELNNSQNIGKLEGMKSLSAEIESEWEKTIDHSGTTPCPLCQSQEGIWTALDQPLWAEGTSIEATDAKGETIIYINDWQTNEANDYHVNGRGTLIFREVKN